MAALIINHTDHNNTSLKGLTKWPTLINDKPEDKLVKSSNCPVPVN